jgi:hypothetical protein
MFLTINEFKNYINETVSTKDWDRVFKISTTRDGAIKMANSLKNKDKAIARFVAGLKLNNEDLTYNPDAYNKFGRSIFAPLGEKAMELGATFDEIKVLYDNTEVPEKYLDKKLATSDAKLDNRFVSKISQFFIDNGFTIEYKNYNGPALTLPGKTAMQRNGSKWTIGYKTVVSKNGIDYTFDFDAITSESVDVKPTYYIAAKSSDKIFNPLTHEVLGIKQFLNRLKNCIKDI